jgi:hypothetical protein
MQAESRSALRAVACRIVGEACIDPPAWLPLEAEVIASGLPRLGEHCVQAIGRGFLPHVKGRNLGQSPGPGNVRDLQLAPAGRAQPLVADAPHHEEN